MATALLGAVIVSDSGASIELMSPVQKLKVFPPDGVGARFIDVPELYQQPLEQSGVIVPVPRGFIAVVNAYCVVRFAVYVVDAPGVVILCVCAPPSLQEENTNRVPAAPDWGDGKPMVWFEPTSHEKVWGAE